MQIMQTGQSTKRRKAGSSLEQTPRETVGHLQSAYCEGHARVVTKAHHNCFRELQYDIAKHATVKMGR